jgi:hypothetical protein
VSTTVTPTTPDTTAEDYYFTGNLDDYFVVVPGKGHLYDDGEYGHGEEGDETADDENYEDEQYYYDEEYEN